MEDDYNSYGTYNEQDNKPNNQYQEQVNERTGHNHEFQSSVDYEKDDEGIEHSHHVSGVTGPSIKYGQSHVHRVYVFTDTSTDHYHEISGTTGPALYINGQKHIHLLAGITTFDHGHKHDFYFTSLVEDPTSVPGKGNY